MLSGKKTRFLLPREVVPRRVAVDVLHCGGFISIATAAFAVIELSSLVQKLLTTSILDFFCYFVSNICPGFWKPWFPEAGFPWFSAQSSSCTAAFLCCFQSPSFHLLQYLSQPSPLFPHNAPCHMTVCVCHVT